MSYRYRFLRFPGGKLKAVTFSYDDGVTADIRFSELLEKYGLKGTFNINSVNREKHLSADQIRDNILARGHEVALHGLHHVASGAASPVDCIKDALFCRQELEGEFGMIIRGMAYPDSGIRNFQNGNSYQTVKASLTSLGIVYARTLGADNDSFKLPEDFHAWVPTAHHDNPSIFEYIDKFNAIDETKLTYPSHGFPKLFYIWGHSFEFDRKNNWDHIEEVCSRISGKDDVWYATNIEIYEYITAYNSLITSADGDIIYNPTLHTIYFALDGKKYTIAPGETIVL